LFERAIAEDPGYAAPHAGLAVAYTYLAVHGWGRAREVMPAAKEHALRALALDEALAEAHWALAYVHEWYEWDWRGAEREFLRAIALNPGDAHLGIVYACFLMFIGRTEAGLAKARRAWELDPVSEEVNRLMVYACWLAGEYDEAVAHGRQAVELHPHGSGLHVNLGLAYGLGGQYLEAIQLLQRAKALTGDDPFYAWALGYVYACQGRRDEAAAIAENLERRRSDAFFSPTWLAILYGAIGELERAFALLDAAFEERDSFLVAVRADPLFAALRSDPRFTDLVRRIGLAD